MEKIDEKSFYESPTLVVLPVAVKTNAIKGTSGTEATIIGNPTGPS